MYAAQTVDSALASKIGEGGLPDERFGAQLAATGPVLERLRVAYQDSSLSLLRVPETSDDLAPLQSAAEKLAEGAEDIVFLGTGGSSLGGQALAQLADYAVPGMSPFRPRPHLHFLDNLDPYTLERFLAVVPLKTARFIAVSKSGGTGETLAQVMSVLTAMDAAGLGSSIGAQMLGLSEPEAGKRNGLRALLEPLGVPFLPHHTGIGGRYSCLTNVGLLPAYLSGLDISALRAGAAEALRELLTAEVPQQCPAAVGAALNATAAESGKNIAVLMAYADRLERMTAWWVQLWSESLGKDGKGTTPMRSLGPVDQHSQLQLHLGGPRDKLFTVVTLGRQNTGPMLNAALATRAGESALGGHAVGDFVAAQGRATIDTFARNGRPVRAIHIETLDERALGYLVMHFMLETVIAADLIGVNAFDQPAVEEGKILAKAYLAGG